MNRYFTAGLKADSQSKSEQNETEDGTSERNNKAVLNTSSFPSFLWFTEGSVKM